MKLCIDPGHGGSSTGATFNGVKEKDITLLVCLCLAKILEAEGHDLILTRSTDEYVSLKDRANIANGFAADSFVSVHCNADPDPDADGMLEAKGEEIWIYENSYHGRQFAEVLLPYVDEIIPGHKSRGIKESAQMYVLRKTHMPAALVEIGFIDNVAESAALSQPFTIIRTAELLAKGILRF